MKSPLLFTLLTLISATKYVACGTPQKVDLTTPTSHLPCDTRLWARTYGAMSRFGEVKPNGKGIYDRHNLKHRCVFDVKATVEAVAPQPDGDMKIWLNLDDANFAYAGAQPPYVPLNKKEFYPDGEYVEVIKNGKVERKKRWVVAEIVCAAPNIIRGLGMDTKTGKDPKTGKVWKLPWEISPVSDPENDGAVIACRGYYSNVYIPQPPTKLKDGTWVREEVYVTGELISDTGAVTNPEWNPKSPPHVPRYKMGHGHVEIHPVTLIRK